jgi:hypothetical protein
VWQAHEVVFRSLRGSAYTAPRPCPAVEGGASELSDQSMALPSGLGQRKTRCTCSLEADGRVFHLFRHRVENGLQPAVGS